MKPAQHLLYQTAPSLNPAGVEAHIRHSRLILAAGSTIDHLSHEELASGAKEAAALEKEHPGTLASLATSLGLARDHDMWDAILFRLHPNYSSNHSPDHSPIYSQEKP